MTSKLTKVHPLNGMHTAGIFSDMSIDGPVIGTLVVVVDRAKNLPNRKTIGKQDPYCAARLGKEAKKTATDIRGGQTPKWDQELRFTVHESPDYYQLKVSVFNDDKKTELIGEAWIDLRDIVVPGGGQSDQWHQLACRGKYAGEVRIEITYYDSRPKPDKPVVKAKPPVSAEPEASPAAAAGPRPVPKRRPLPSDPVTGQAPALPPSPGPEQIDTPPRPQPTTTGPRELGTPSKSEASAHQYRTPDRPEPYAGQHDDRGYSPNYQQQPQAVHDFPQADDRSVAEDDRPPPPPAHRSRTGSGASMGPAYQSTPPTMRHDVLRSEAHRNSASASYPGRPTYKAYDSAPAGLTGSQYSGGEQTSPARHYSYDAAYDMPQRTMQATVEDVPESPESMGNPFGRTSGRWAQSQPQAQPQPQPQVQYEPEFDVSASPAPLSLSARASSELARYPQGAPSPDTRFQYRAASTEIPHTESPEYAPDFGRGSELSIVSRGSQGDQRALTYRSELDDTSNGYSVPPVPASLVPGIDASLALEISERINQDRRQSDQRRYTQQVMMETPPRGRTMDQGYGHSGSPAAYDAAPIAHGRSPVMYTNGPSTSSVNVVIKSRAYSPNPPRDPSPNPHHQHTIRRKSVSPQPPVDTTRRLSGVPFGPDSYDALNPSASAAALKDGPASRPDYHEATGKIITHDGREVDPSDHLPMETWAPEPEPKAPSSTSPAARPSPSGPQPPPSSGRRPLRVAGRPQSMLPSSSAITFSGGPDHVEPVTPSPPVSTGRNRLQKKAAYRQSTSAIAPVMSGAIGPGPANDGFRRSSGNPPMDPVPLAPIPPHQDNFTPPRRAATFDYAMGPSSGENYAPHHHRHAAHSPGSGGMYGSSPGSRSGAPPPIPAKVPLALLPAPSSVPPDAGMSGAMQLHSSSLARRASSGIDDDGGRGAGFYDQHQQHHQPQHRHQQQYGQQHDVYGGGGGRGGQQQQPLSLEEELRQIDIGSGRSSRRHQTQGYQHQGQGQGQYQQGHHQQGSYGGHGQGQGYVYGQGGY